jgi:hypothetical protein
MSGLISACHAAIIPGEGRGRAHDGRASRQVRCGSKILIATGERRRRHRPVLKAAPEQLSSLTINPSDDDKGDVAWESRHGCAPDRKTHRAIAPSPIFCTAVAQEE